MEREQEENVIKCKFPGSQVMHKWKAIVFISSTEPFTKNTPIKLQLFDHSLKKVLKDFNYDCIGQLH